MKFVSIDVETAGLNPEMHCLLSVGMVIGDTELPLDKQPEYPPLHLFIEHKLVCGDPYALHLNRDILGVISGRLPVPDEASLVSVGELNDLLYTYCSTWLGPLSWIAAGKNFAGFDRPFLESKLASGFQTKKFTDCLKHRVLDPGSMLALGSDEVPPDLQSCARRAGIAYDPALAHDALYDARVVRDIVVKHLHDTH